MFLVIIFMECNMDNIDKNKLVKKFKNLFGAKKIKVSDINDGIELNNKLVVSIVRDMFSEMSNKLETGLTYSKTQLSFKFIPVFYEDYGYIIDNEMSFNVNLAKNLPFDYDTYLYIKDDIFPIDDVKETLSENQDFYDLFEMQHGNTKLLDADSHIVSIISQSKSWNNVFKNNDIVNAGSKIDINHYLTTWGKIKSVTHPYISASMGHFDLIKYMFVYEHIKNNLQSWLTSDFINSIIRDKDYIRNKTIDSQIVEIDFNYTIEKNGKVVFELKSNIKEIEEFLNNTFSVVVISMLKVLKMSEYNINLLGANKTPDTFDIVYFEENPLQDDIYDIIEPTEKHLKSIQKRMTSLLSKDVDDLSLKEKISLILWKSAHFMYGFKTNFVEKEEKTVNLDELSLTEVSDELFNILNEKTSYLFNINKYNFNLDEIAVERLIFILTSMYLYYDKVKTLSDSDIINTYNYVTFIISNSHELVLETTKEQSITCSNLFNSIAFERVDEDDDFIGLSEEEISEKLFSLDIEKRWDDAFEQQSSIHSKLHNPNSSTDEQINYMTLLENFHIDENTKVN